MTWEIREGDCVELMRAMPAASVDSVVCDPPYGLEFMGKAWDRPWQMGKVSDAGAADGSPFRRNTGTPSWAASGNPVCRNCGGTKYDRTRPNGCECDAPNFPNEAADQMRAFQAWCEAWAREAFRVLKPGGYLLAFGGTRTYHRMAAGVEDAGFEIRDQLQWLYGSGFPKSLDVSKAIDKAAGAERETLSVERRVTGSSTYDTRPSRPDGLYASDEFVRPAPATLDAERWQGWGTALKPAHEPIVMARKPLVGTVAANVLAHGTGAINVDGCRIEGDVPSVPQPALNSPTGNIYGYKTGEGRNGEMSSAPGGRWPANVLLDEVAAGMLDEQTGTLSSGAEGPGGLKRNGDKFRAAYGDFAGTERESGVLYGDSGGASRFLYVAKASTAERNAGLEAFTRKPSGMVSETSGQHITRRDGGAPPPRANVHPTVKPITVMRWLARLVTPPGGTVLDPFTGSGTTGIAATLEGFGFVGLEQQGPEWVKAHPGDDDYIAIAEARIRWWQLHPEGMELVKALEADRARRAVADSGQIGMFDA